jgi:hypothetical protein
MAKKPSGRIGNLGAWAHPPKGKSAAPKVVAAAKPTPDKPVSVKPMRGGK